MVESQRDYRKFQQKLFTVLLTIIIFLALTNPLTVFFLPKMDKLCFPILFLFIIVFTILPGRYGEVFVRRVNGKVEKIYVSENFFCPLFLLSFYIYLYLILMFVFIVFTDGKDFTEDPFLTALMSILLIFFTFILALIVMKPTTITYDGNVLRIVPSPLMRGVVNREKPTVVYYPTSVFINPFKYLFHISLRGGPKEVAVPKMGFEIEMESEKDSKGSLARLSVFGTYPGAQWFHILLSNDKELFHLIDALKELMGPDWNEFVAGKDHKETQQTPGEEAQSTPFTYAGAQSSP